MKLVKPIIAACLICGLSQTNALADSEWILSGEDGVELNIDLLQLPHYPNALVAQGYTEGTVKVSIDIDHHGELRDWIIVESTHPLFSKALERVIDTWRFSPPKINGEARSVVTQIDIEFGNNGTLLTSSLPTDIVSRQFNQLTGYESERVGIASINDLDTYPNPVKQIPPAVSKKMIKSHNGAVAVFSFYVDESGQVRIPVLTDTNGDPDVQMLVAAQDAISQWKFEPPTQNEKPVKIKLSQAFVFTKN